MHRADGDEANDIHGVTGVGNGIEQTIVKHDTNRSEGITYLLGTASEASSQDLKRIIRRILCFVRYFSWNDEIDPSWLHPHRPNIAIVKNELD